MMTVNEVSKLTGVSVRTLHYYDEIGLLHPSTLTNAGYRLYNEENLSKLQQVLFFKEIGFSLKEIKAILENDNYDKSDVLTKQKQLLLLKQKRLAELISLIDKNLKGENDMSFKEFDMSEIEQMQDKFKEEVKEKWGDSKAYKEYIEKSSKYTKNNWKDINAEGDEIFKELALNMDKGADSKEVQNLILKWKNYITKNFYECTDEILSGLGQMYIADERFTKNIDKHAPGLAEFISNAIKIFCNKH